MYTPANEGVWADWDLRPPAYYGTPVEHLDELGRLIGDDPRFHLCTARNFLSYFMQMPREQVPTESVEAMRDVFVESGFDAAELARSVVLSESFLASRARRWDVPDAPGPLVLRPEQLARSLEHATGFRWLANPDPEGCTGECWGQVDLLQTDLFGYRAMFGGIDGFMITEPVHAASPTKLLVLERVADEAAGFAVGRDLALPSEERTLLRELGSEPDAGDDLAQLIALHGRLFGQRVSPGHPDLIQTESLLAAARGMHADDEVAAWELVVAAMLQHPSAVFY
jgi:hypothetical protein